MTNLFGLIADIFKAAYLAARNRPQVTCDVHHIFEARWGPDYFHNDDGEIIAEGIRLELTIAFLLANNGPVDTMLKDAYIVIRRDKKELGRLTHFRSKYWKGKIHEIQIGPRKVWGPEYLHFGGFLEGVTKVTKDLKAKLIIEPVAQHPLSKKIHLYF